MRLNCQHGVDAAITNHRITDLPHKPNALSFRMFFVLVGVMMISGTSTGTQTGFQQLYDYYFPKNGQYLNTFYRRSFDATLFGPVPKSNAERHGFYFAFRGEAAAFHAFLNHPDREGAGEFAETWANECLLLLLGLGDERFSDLLAHENQRTREVVGMVIDSRINWTKHRFPKTRALYFYRWVPLSKQEIKQRRGLATVEVEVKMTHDNLSRFEAALATDTRFSDVNIYRDHGAPGVVLIKAPRTLSKEDITYLQNLIQRRVTDNRPVVLK